MLLEDFTFIVSEASRQRVLREQRRNVHSFNDPMDNMSFDKDKYSGMIQGTGVYLLEK